MAARRFIHWNDSDWSLNRLARAYCLPPSTLAHRLERFGETSTGILRALSTGIIDCRMAGRIGAKRSPWRYPD